ncbi:MAG: hypothetical protein QXT67_03420 [Candidatus Bathyarchaeia archaeon]
MIMKVRYYPDLRIMIIGTIIISKAIINDTNTSINVAEPVISFHAKTRDKKISTNRVYPIFIIDLSIVSELITYSLL